MSAKSIGNAFVNKIIDKFLTPNGFTHSKAGTKIIWIPKKDEYGRPIYRNGKPELRPIQGREDFFGCIDLIAIHREYYPHSFFIQATVGGVTALNQRKRKIAAEPNWHLGRQRVMIWQRHETNKQIVIVWRAFRDVLESKSGINWSRKEFDFRSPDIAAALGAENMREITAEGAIV